MKVINESIAGLGEIKGTRKWYARLLAVGHGSSAVHTREAVAQTGPSAWPQGTKIYINHQGWESLMEQPAGDLNHLAGIIAGEPEFIDGEDAGLYAPIEISEKWGAFVEEFKDFIGLSIRSGFYGEEIDENTGLPIVEGYIPSKLNSVDLVTVPGAKGKILNAIESYKEKHGIITHEPIKTRKEGQEVTPEEIQEAVKSALSALLPQIVEAITPEPLDEPNEETEEVDVATVTEAVVAANLPLSARTRVYSAVEAGREVTEAIESERKYIEELTQSLQESHTGRIHTATDTKVDFTQGGWN